MDLTGAVCPWGGDPCRDTPVVPDFTALRLAAQVVAQDAQEGR